MISKITKTNIKNDFYLQISNFEFYHFWCSKHRFLIRKYKNFQCQIQNFDIRDLFLIVEYHGSSSDAIEWLLPCSNCSQTHIKISSSELGFLNRILMKNHRFDKEEIVGARWKYFQKIRNRKLLLERCWEVSTVPGSSGPWV